MTIYLLFSCIGHISSFFVEVQIKMNYLVGVFIWEKLLFIKTTTTTTTNMQTNFEMDDWEVQDLNLCIEPETPTDVPETPAVAPLPSVPEETVVVTEETAQAVTEMTPRTFMTNLLLKTYKTYQSQKSLPAFKRTVKQYNMDRDTNIRRVDIIREVLAGRAILKNGEIQWKHAYSLRKYDISNPIFTDPLNWAIRTKKELHAKFVKVNEDIHFELTKAQLKRGETPY